MKSEENGDACSMRTCETPGCEKEARLQCPTCIKLQIQVSNVALLDFGHSTAFLSYFPSFRARFSAAKNASQAAGIFIRHSTSWPREATLLVVASLTGPSILGPVMFSPVS